MRIRLSRGIMYSVLHFVDDEAGYLGLDARSWDRIRDQYLPEPGGQLPETASVSLLARNRHVREQIELHAVEEMRLRKPGVPWFIPVRPDECEMPAIDIGDGRTLGAIQRADLYGPRSAEQTAQLIGAVQRILGRRPSASQQAAVPIRTSDGDWRGSEDVLVVAAGFAYQRQYLAVSAYACQPSRSFREVARIAFYADGAIRQHVARIRYRELHVRFSEQEAATRRVGSAVDQRVARLRR